MNWQLIATLTGVMFFAHWLTYIMGEPLGDNPRAREILFSVPYWLAVRRLNSFKLLGKIKASQAAELEMTTDPGTRRLLLIDQRLAIYLKGRELFTWERALLCPVCLHWWATLIVVVFLLSFDMLGARADLWLACLTYLFTHFLIRKF